MEQESVANCALQKLEGEKWKSLSRDDSLQYHGLLHGLFQAKIQSR